MTKAMRISNTYSVTPGICWTIGEAQAEVTCIQCGQNVLSAKQGRLQFGENKHQTAFINKQMRENRDKSYSNPISIRFGIVFFVKEVLFFCSMREGGLNTLNFNYPRDTKKKTDPNIPWWLGIRDDIVEQLKNCTASKAASTNSETYLQKAEKNRKTNANEPDEDLDIVFTEKKSKLEIKRWNPNFANRRSFRFLLLTKVCTNTEPNRLNNFSQNHFSKGETGNNPKRHRSGF